MKRLTILATLLLTSAPSFAFDTAIGLKGRFDYIHSKLENKPGTETSSGVMTTSYLALITSSKINETTQAKLVLNFRSDSTLDNGAQNMVNEANLTKTHDAFSAIIGKQAILTGGRENDYSYRDMYIYSRFADTYIYYATGLSLGYSKNGQNLYVQYLEQADSVANPLTDKKITGVAYYGDWMNQMIMPIISYHRYGTNRPGAYNNIFSGSLRFTIDKFFIEGDYLTNEQEKFSASGDAKVTSVVTHARYMFEQGFQPFAKFITEKGKNGFSAIVSGATESERKAFEVGVEYYPVKDEDMRYHVVYNNSTSKETSPSTNKIEEQKFYAGIAFNYNILK